jgi:hypothetical protein
MIDLIDKAAGRRERRAFVLEYNCVEEPAGRN